MACFTAGFVFAIDYSCLFGLSVVLKVSLAYMGMSYSIEILLSKLKENVKGWLNDANIWWHQTHIVCAASHLWPPLIVVVSLAAWWAALLWPFWLTLDIFFGLLFVGRMAKSWICFALNKPNFATRHWKELPMRKALARSALRTSCSFFLLR